MIVRNTHLKDLIEQEFGQQNDCWQNVEYMTLTENGLYEIFDATSIGRVDKSFTLWTKSRVYFPVEHMGDLNVRSVPRFPCNEKTEHITGES